MKTTLLHEALAVVCLLLVPSLQVSGQVPGMLNYQGRVSVNGTNFTGNGNFKFALVSGGRNENRQATGVALRAGKFIYEVEVTDGGAGYSQPPAVRLLGGGGSGAEAVATVSNGVVTWIEVFNPGNNYTSEPVVEIDPPQDSLVYETFWSNDGSSANGFEPAGSVPVTAEKGLFSALIGADGMNPVPDNVFTNESVYLRVWFSPGGSNAFEQLVPDQRIATVGYAMKSQNAANAENALNAANAITAQNATIASTVENGAITTAKLADNSITVDKVAPELFDAVLPAEGSVSGYSVLSSGSTTAQPNTKYLMPEDGTGVLTLPANPPIGTTIQVSGQGTIFANTNQLIGGLWFKTDTSRPGQYWQHFVSGDGRTVVSFNPMLQSIGSTNFPSRVRIFKIDGSVPQDFSTPTNSYGDSGPMGQLAVSADAQTLVGSFAVADHNTYVLHVSTNGAGSWEPIALPDSLTNFTRFGSLACSSDGRTLYALAHDPSISTNKVIKSTDRGNSWTTIDSIPSEYSLPAPGPEGAQLSTSGDGSTVMIPVGPMHSSPNSLLVSTNGGDSWFVANPTNGVTNISGWLPQRAVLAGGNGKIAIPARLSYPIGGNGEAVALLVSTNFGNSWSASWDERFRVSPPPPDFHLVSGQSGGSSLYVLASPYTPGAGGTQSASVLASRDLGQSWVSVFTTESTTPPYAQRANMLFASDAMGFQVAVARSVAPPTEPGNSGIYLSAGNKLSLTSHDSSGELVYRGDGRWSILSSKNASSSIGMPPPETP